MVFNEEYYVTPEGQRDINAVKLHLAVETNNTRPASTHETIDIYNIGETLSLERLKNALEFMMETADIVPVTPMGLENMASYKLTKEDFNTLCQHFEITEARSIDELLALNLYQGIQQSRPNELSIGNSTEKVHIILRFENHDEACQLIDRLAQFASAALESDMTKWAETMKKHVEGKHSVGIQFTTEQAENIMGAMIVSSAQSASAILGQNVPQIEGGEAEARQEK